MFVVDPYCFTSIYRFYAGYIDINYGIYFQYDSGQISAVGELLASEFQSGSFHEKMIISCSEELLNCCEDFGIGIRDEIVSFYRNGKPNEISAFSSDFHEELERLASDVTIISDQSGFSAAFYMNTQAESMITVNNSQVGPNSGSGYDVDEYGHGGAGAYVCGEESALIESLDEEESFKPPFPATAVLFGCPITAQNVSVSSEIIRQDHIGGEWLASFGNYHSK